MENLANEHLYLLLDEPIYVVPDHGDHPLTEEKEEIPLPAFLGENKKGIGVFIGNNPDSEDQDLEFLFKGLNALDITAIDIALFKEPFNENVKYPDHQKRLEFDNQISEEMAFSVQKTDHLSLMQAKPLASIRNDIELKKRFWLGLKALFTKA